MYCGVYMKRCPYRDSDFCPYFIRIYIDKKKKKFKDIPTPKRSRCPYLYTTSCKYMRCKKCSKIVKPYYYTKLVKASRS